MTTAMNFKALGPNKINSRRLFAIIMVCLCSLRSIAETGLGTIQGSVTSANGKQVAAATITLRSEREGTALFATTDSSGHYRFSAVPSGVYRATVARAGYESAIRPGLRLRKGATLSLHFVLNRAPRSAVSVSSASSLSAVQYYDQPAFKMGQLTDPAAGGGYSDAAGARASEMIGEYLSPPQPAPNASLAPSRGSFEGNSGSLGRLQRAVAEEPSEANFQRLGSALLARRSFLMATQTFQHGVLRYKDSAGLWTGLGISLYSQGRYNEATETLSRAARLEPGNVQIYDFLGEASQFAAPSNREAALLLKRFAESQPRNPRAHYDYALSLLKVRTQEEPGALNTAESELKTAINLNPRLADAYFQLGALYDAQNRTGSAIRQYQAAVRLKPGLAAAHYRLARDYLRAGNSAQARGEFNTYRNLRPR